MSFSSITGHEFQKEFLIKSIEKGRVANSYLFYGHEGIGKRLIALEFAKLLNCIRSDNGFIEKSQDLCNCASCLKITSSNHPDVTVVEPEDSSEIKVKQIREQIEDLVYLKPYEGKYKVCIVNNADFMNTNAQNAFLKTLEEPPLNAVIILITSKPQYLLKTIVSRCQGLEFFRLSEKVIENAIGSNTEISSELSHTAVKLSQGSMSKAILLDANMISERKRIIETIARLSCSNPVELLEFIDSIATDKTAEGTRVLKLLFETLYLWLKDILYVKSEISDEYLIHKDISSITLNYSKRCSIEYILELQQFLEQSWDALFNRNVNKQYVLENLVIRFANARQ
ncbi:MAG: hypothetical protein GTN99_09730 [Candidatus Dadabacteria bacterium]|nr:hypothetical protein [Candidatus Dadabacteria bacterium]